jgi:GAF domain-containing protein
MLQPISDRPLRTIYDPPSLLNDLETLAAKVAVNIRQSLQLEDILRTSVAEVREVLGADRAVIYKFNPDRSGEVIVENVIEPWKSILWEEINDVCFEHSWHLPFTKGLAVATDDVEEFHAEPCYLRLLKYLQIRANIVAPIMQDDYLYGTPQCQDSKRVNLRSNLAD